VAEVTATQRRTRRTSTARRPDIARDLARASAACLALPTLTSPRATISVADAVDALAWALARSIGPDGEADPRAVAATNRRRVVVALTEAAVSSGHRGSVPRLQARIGAAWDDGGDVAVPGDVAATVAAISRHGVDAATLLEGVVRHEAGRHLGLVRQQSNKLAASYGGYRAEDLFGWGWAGLIVALRRYDPSTSAFSTYAVHRIVGHIQDGVRAESPVPKRLATYKRKAEGIAATLGASLGRAPGAEEVASQLAEAHLASQLGRRPTLDEVVERLDAELAQLALLPRLTNAASIEELTDPDSGRSPLGVTSEADDPAVAIGRILEAERIAAALAELRPEVAEVVRIVDLDGTNATVAARQLGISGRELRERRDEGLGALRELLADLAPVA
jgi:RNA polymerase sigma factor (sigma-70 family)